MRLRAVSVCLLVAMLVGMLPATAVAASGDAGYRYRWHRHSAVALGPWCSLAAGKGGQRYSASAGATRVEVSGPSGSFSMGTSGGSAGDFAGVRALATDRWDRLYVADSAAVRVFGWEGASMRLLSSFAASNVWGLAVAEDGTIVTSNAGTTVVLRDSGFAPLASFSTSSNVTGLATDAEGHVFAAEPFSPWGEGVRQYGRAGGFEGAFGVLGTQPGQLSAPSDIDVDAFGQLIVADTGNLRVQVFDATHAFKTLLAGPADKPFTGPLAVAAGRQRDLYVADSASELYGLETTAATAYSEIAGVHRYQTSAKASKRAYPDGAPAVVMATGEQFPDALGGAALAGALHAPLLLTRKLSCPG